MGKVFVLVCRVGDSVQQLGPNGRNNEASALLMDPKAEVLFRTRLPHQKEQPKIRN